MKGVQGLGSWVSGFGNRVWEFGASGSGLLEGVQGLGFRAPGFGCRVSGLGSRVQFARTPRAAECIQTPSRSRFVFRASDSNSGFRVSLFVFWVSVPGSKVSGLECTSLVRADKAEALLVPAVRRAHNPHPAGSRRPAVSG